MRAAATRKRPTSEVVKEWVPVALQVAGAVGVALIAKKTWDHFFKPSAELPIPPGMKPTLNASELQSIANAIYDGYFQSHYTEDEVMMTEALLRCNNDADVATVDHLIGCAKSPFLVIPGCTTMSQMFHGALNTEETNVLNAALRLKGITIQF